MKRSLIVLAILSLSTACGAKFENTGGGGTTTKTTSNLALFGSCKYGAEMCGDTYGDPEQLAFLRSLGKSDAEISNCIGGGKVFSSSVCSPTGAVGKCDYEVLDPGSKAQVGRATLYYFQGTPSDAEQACESLKAIYSNVRYTPL